MRKTILRRLVHLALVPMLAFAGSALLHAHDFWIVPSAFRANAGALVRIALHVGHAWDGEPVRRVPARFTRFTVVSDEGEQAVQGQDGAHPAGLHRPAGADGIQVVTYQSVHVRHLMDGPAFERYLEEEGLTGISDLRRSRGETDTPGREVYSRCAKALLAIGDPARGGHDRRVGLTLELVPQVNPYTLRPSEQLPVQVLYRGEPVADILVVAVSQRAPHDTVRARTDPDGRVRLLLDRAGPWLVKAVHMVAAPQGVDADWESFWASLTFEAP